MIFLHLLHRSFANNLGKSLMSEAHRPSFALLLLPPACILYSRAANQKEQWEKVMFWLYCNALLTIFSIKLLLLILTPDLWQWSPQTIFWATIAATHSRLLREDSSTKWTVRKGHVLIILHFLLAIFSN